MTALSTLLQLQHELAEARERAYQSQPGTVKVDLWGLLARLGKD